MFSCDMNFFQVLTLELKPEGKSILRALLSIKPRKTIYHCKADKLKFAKISMFFYFAGYISAQRPANSILATCT